MGLKESVGLQRVRHNWTTFTQNPQQFPCTISCMAMWPVLGSWVRNEFSLFLPTLDLPAQLQRPRHHRNTLIGHDCSPPAHQKGWVELFKRWGLAAHKQAVHLLKCAAAHLPREKGRPRIASFCYFYFLVISFNSLSYFFISFLIQTYLREHFKITKWFWLCYWLLLLNCGLKVESVQILRL